MTIEIMARHTQTAWRQQATAVELFHCRDCRHSYDWHSKAIDGHLILCRCKLDVRTGHGKWCKFLNDPQCPEFEHC